MRRCRKRDLLGRLMHRWSQDPRRKGHSMQVLTHTCKLAGVFRLRCGHAYHMTCLRTWFQQKTRCPSCQQEFGKVVAWCQNYHSESIEDELFPEMQCRSGLCRRVAKLLFTGEGSTGASATQCSGGQAAPHWKFFLALRRLPTARPSRCRKDYRHSVLL